MLGLNRLMISSCVVRCEFLLASGVFSVLSWSLDDVVSSLLEVSMDLAVLLGPFMTTAVEVVLSLSAVRIVKRHLSGSVIWSGRKNVVGLSLMLMVMGPDQCMVIAGIGHDVA